MKTIEAETCERTWLEATSYLLSQPRHEAYNLILQVASPATSSKSDRHIYNSADTFLRTHNAQPVVTVAETIFPGGAYRRHGPKGVYEVYPNDIYPRIKTGSEWGRYAYRLVRRKGAPGSPDLNPLEITVKKIRGQLRNGSRMRACYELSASDPDLDLPLYNPATDSGRTRNGPCLSHISLKLGREDELYLTALYRSHYYIARALGNLKGLASLQAFICDETKLRPGPLVCVSTLAVIDPEFSISDVRSLVAEINGHLD